MSPGDEVVCISSTVSCPNCGTLASASGFPPPERGRHYIVALSGLGGCTRCLQRIPVMQAAGHRSTLFAWPQHLFRPLSHETDDEFLSATTPTPVLEPAT